MIYVNLQIATEQTDNIPDLDEIQRICDCAILPRKQEAELSIRIVTEEESHELNLQYRDKDRPTNVLSFPYEFPEELPLEIVEEMELDNIYIGDLAICKNVVEKEAQEQNKPLNAHWAHMIVHGCLHLLGYDHITDEDANVMEPLETKIMQDLGFENPYKDDEN